MSQSVLHPTPAVLTPDVIVAALSRVALEPWAPEPVLGERLIAALFGSPLARHAPASLAAALGSPSLHAALGRTAKYACVAPFLGTSAAALCAREPGIVAGLQATLAAALDAFASSSAPSADPSS